MSELDDLINDINQTSSKKKKGPKAPQKPKEEKKVEEAKLEPIIEEKKNENIDDLLNDINNTKTEKKGGKKKKKAVNEEVDESKPEVKEEIKQEFIPETKEQKVEEKKEEKEDEEEEDEEKDKKKPGKKKGKKKKAGKNDMLIQFALEKKRREKELQDEIQRELELKLQREREEEELRQKKLAEEKAEEERIKKEKLDKQKDLDLYGVKQKDIEEMGKNLKETEKNIQKQGYDNLDQFLEKIKQEEEMKKGLKKNKGKRRGDKDKDKNTNLIEETSQHKPDVPVDNEFKDDEKKPNKISNDVVYDDWEEMCEESDKKTDEPKLELKKEDKPNITIETNPVKVNKNNIDFSEIEPTMNKETRYRSPIICVLGHVDTGKTSLLDKLRSTNVQIGEAGGITQQIGATYFPIQNFKKELDKIPENFKTKEIRIPGLLVIDTPGHESFTNLRNRGSSLCDLAILVVDMMHGMQNQTIESLNLLRSKKTPFIIALNKIDRINQWKSATEKNERHENWASFRKSLGKQKNAQIKEFNDRLQQNTTEMIKNSMNVSLYDQNPNMKEYINIVPTSAHTGEGLPDLLGLLVHISQKFLVKQLEYQEEIQCIILEVKVLDQLGPTIDVILVNGTVKIGDFVILGGMFGPIRSQIKCLMTPSPMKESRVKSDYQHHEQISGSMGIKIFGPGLENALSGAPLFTYKTEQEAKNYEEEIFVDSDSVLKQFLSKSGKGILVQSSTLGSLEAMLLYMSERNIEIAAVGLGHLNKKDVVKIQTIHANSDKQLKEHMTILAFDVKVSEDAELYAKTIGVKIFTADIIYHLFDKYIEYEKTCIAERKKEKEKEAVFPCELKILQPINKKDPIIIGVELLGGILKIGTPLYAIDKKLLIGIVEGIENNKKPVNNVRTGSVAIRIKAADNTVAFGRHFDEKDILVSKISRNSIDALKEFFRDDMTQEDWELVIKLKPKFDL